MTDTLTERDYWAVLRAVLETVPAGTYWSAAKWHTEAVLAELSSRQIGRAHERACEEGWLEPMGRIIDGQWSTNMTPATHEGAKGRWIFMYRRTDKGYRPTLFDEPPLFEVDLAP
jgi:hypothetical protein